MHIQNINDLINLQDIDIVKISEVEDNIVYLTIEPVNKLQSCVLQKYRTCYKKGIRGYRKVRHLPIYGNITILLISQIRLHCKKCLCDFTFKYEFIDGKSRYTNQYKDNIADAVTGSTVVHASEFTGTPYSTVERIFKNYFNNIKPKICTETLELSKNWY